MKKSVLREREAGGIYTRYAKDPEADPNDYSMHIHDRCELYYFVDGTADYGIEGARYHLKKGDLLLMRPGEAHCARILEKGCYERFAINFPLDLFDAIDPERRLMKPFTQRELGEKNLYEAPDLMGLFRKACDVYEDDYARGIVLYSAILQIMTSLGDLQSQTSPGRPGKAHSLPDRILEYVNDHLFEELNIPDLAGRFFLSPSQLGRIFRQTMGAAPWEYITAKRLIAARDLIRQGAGAADAALQCGFGDYSAFYRAYVKRYGVSPRSHRG